MQEKDKALGKKKIKLDLNIFVRKNQNHKTTKKPQQKQTLSSASTLMAQTLLRLVLRKDINKKVLEWITSVSGIYKTLRVNFEGT